MLRVEVSSQNLNKPYDAVDKGHGVCASQELHEEITSRGTRRAKKGGFIALETG